MPYQRVNPWLPHDWEKEHTFDDVFLRIQGDYGQVACKASKTGQKIYLYFENVGIEFSFTFEPPFLPISDSFLPVDEVCAGEGVNITNAKVQRFWSIDWPGTVITHLFYKSDKIGVVWGWEWNLENVKNYLF